MAPRPKSGKRKASLFARQNLFTGGTTTLKVRVTLECGLSGPLLPLRMEALDPVFVLKCKIECALRLLRETQGEDACGVLAAAEDIELSYRGIPMRDMTSMDRYGVENGADISASYVPQPKERDTVKREAEYVHLDAQIMGEPGVPSTGTIKRIVAQRGKLCQVCWRSRWFRAQVLNVYSTSVLLAWHDWPDAEWPNFFVHIALSAAPGLPPQESDETWRIRWHRTKPTAELPDVQPRYRELPPLNWVKAFLRTYAVSDESSMLREIQSTLPRELVEARQQAASRHRCLILGATAVGKSTLVSAFCAGPPPPAAPTLALDGLGASGAGAGAPRRSKDSTYWPTVGTKCMHGSVLTPGIAPLQLELWDTSGNARFKPLSLVFFRQAQSVILVFDVKSMASFRALSAVGGWMHEFTRLTGASPRNFPFVLVGNKAEEDLMHAREVQEEDVREWLYKDGGRMPYIETAFGADPTEDWRHAEHVFRTVARTAHRMKENFGRHRPPETVRVAPEEEYTGDLANEDLLTNVSQSFVRSFKKKAPVGAPVAKRGPSLTDQFAQLVKEPLEKASTLKAAAEELVLCGKRSLDNVKEKLAGGAKPAEGAPDRPTGSSSTAAPLVAFAPLPDVS